MPANKRPGFLRNLFIDRIDLVDRGGNQKANIALFKRDGDPPDPDKKGGKSMDDFLTKIFKGIGKALGWSDDQIQKAEDEALSFDEAMQSRVACEEIWDMVSAIRESLSATLKDSKVDRGALIRGSLDQFTASVEAALPKWLAGQSAVSKAGRKIAQDRLDRLQGAHDALGTVIQEAQAAFDEHDGIDPNADKPAVGADGKTEQKPAAAGQEPAPTTEQGDKPPASGQATDDKTLAAADKVPEPKKVAKGDDPMNRPNMTGASAEILKYLETLEANQKVAPTIKDEVAKALEEMADTHPIKKALIDAQAEAAASKEIAKRLEDQQLTTVYLVKAQGLPHVIGDAATFAPVLKAAGMKMTAEEYAALEGVLKSADALIAAGGVFKEEGRGGAGAAGSAEGKLNAKATEIAKAQNIPFAQAFTKAMDENPQLYTEYLSEHPKQNGGA